MAAAAAASKWSSRLYSFRCWASSGRGCFSAPAATASSSSLTKLSSMGMGRPHSFCGNRSGVGMLGYTLHERSYRREPLPAPSELDLQEAVAKIDMDPKKMMSKDDPGAVVGIIRDVMPVGYFLQLPSGREAYLPAEDLGFTGGLAILQRLFKEGQELVVRIVCRGGAGREIVSCKKPEFAPPSEQKTIESMRLHFEWEKKNAMRPRRR